MVGREALNRLAASGARRGARPGRAMLRAMIDHASVSAPRRPVVRGSSFRWLGSWRWEGALAAGAVAAATVAIWVTSRAGFLAYPGWLAVQKADLIIGPIAVGLYWRHKRPRNHLGSLLIVLGLVGVPYILTASTDPKLFAIGGTTEAPIYAMTSAVILAFPSGRIEGVAAKVTLAGSVIFCVVSGLVVALADPQAGPAFSISGCRAACPANGLAIWSTPAWLPTFNDVSGALLIAIPIATAGVLVWRFITGTPPRRRALSIGAPIALLFLAMQVSYRTLFFLTPDGLAASLAPVHSALQWTLAAARSFVWYGFLFALIVAELFAGRTLRRLVGDSLGRPSLDQLEAMVREPLGDPGLRLGFWRPSTRDWVGGDGAVLEPPAPGQTLSVVERGRRPAVAIVHDAQLSEDPELLEAAAAVALMALENAELDTAWRDSLRELEASRLRITEASGRERRRLERDLHDGAQQRLMAIQIRLTLLREDHEKCDLDDRLEAIRLDAEEAVAELRALARGIYPALLRDRGLADALRSLAMRAPVPMQVTDEGIGRCPGAVEAGIYFCSLEAVQNATKHAGRGARLMVVVGRDVDKVYFSVADDGVGMAMADGDDGMGLVDMRDRIGAVGGELEVVSSPGVGTTVRGTVPIHGHSPPPQSTLGSG